MISLQSYTIARFAPACRRTWMPAVAVVQAWDVSVDAGCIG